METGIHVGNKIDAKETVGPMADAVAKVLETIANNRIDRETGIAALELLRLSASNGVTVQNCSVIGGNVVDD